MVCTYCHTPLAEQSRFCPICGASLSDPALSTRQRAALKDLFDAVKLAVEDRYRVSEMLGRGGMGAVFLAEDLRLGRMVAIKVLRPELAEESASVARFQREVRIAALLDHPNIIPVYAVEEVGDLHYFVMKYLRGNSLDELLQEQLLPVEQSRRILWQAARGLGHAHRRGVIHRDVKPSNIMVDENGQAVITDFGISKAVHSNTHYTSTGQMLGTPQYLSPEQARDLPADGRSDQYSLAVVGYQMLVGRPPVVAETVHSLLYKHIYEVPTPARAARPEVPADLSDALQRALSKKPEERFGTLEEFADAVWTESVTHKGRFTPTEEREARKAPRSSTPAQARTVNIHRRRLKAAVAGVVLVMAVMGLVVAVLRGRGGEPPVIKSEVQTAAGSGPISPDSPGTREQAPTTGVIPLTLPPDSVSPESAATSVLPPVPPKPRVPPRARKLAPAGPPVGARDTAAPQALVPSVGYVTINAVPYGTVSIDGVEIGDTPIVRYELAPGRHVIRIMREGFRTDSTTTTITPGNEVRLSRPLVEEIR